MPRKESRKKKKLMRILTGGSRKVSRGTGNREGPVTANLHLSLQTERDGLGQKVAAPHAATN